MANDMQANILRHALVLFAKDGFEGVSMRNIAAAADTKLPLIYHYFPDKQALYDAAVHEAFSYMTERMLHAAHSRASGKARLRAFLQKLVELQASSTPEVRLVDRELLEARPETMMKLGPDLFQRPHDALVEIIRNLSPAAPAQEIAEHLIAVTYGAVKLRTVRAQLKGLKRLREVAGIADSVTAFAFAAIDAMGGTDDGAQQAATSAEPLPVS
ncbi:MAG TPA: helix-turn-helix domain-containing protein [Rhizomicrobium sp.]|nr:helix-turn-helix domain-containing protein [Rhizomicrobium sp.]